VNIEDLVELSADEWDKLSNEELTEICKKFFNVTRPELAVKPTAEKKKYEPVYIDPKKKKAMEVMAELGIDVDFMTYRKKK